MRQQLLLAPLEQPLQARMFEEVGHHDDRRINAANVRSPP